MNVTYRNVHQVFFLSFPLLFPDHSATKPVIASSNGSAGGLKRNPRNQMVPKKIEPFFWTVVTWWRIPVKMWNTFTHLLRLPTMRFIIGLATIGQGMCVCVRVFGIIRNVRVAKSAECAILGSRIWISFARETVFLATNSISMWMCRQSCARLRSSEREQTRLTHYLAIDVMFKELLVRAHTSSHCIYS